MVSSPLSQVGVDRDGRGRKRRRIALACEECRDRKRKCEGQRPVCGACARRPGQVCTWNDDRCTKGWSNNYVEGLRSRIFELEEALRSNETHKSHGNNPTQLPSPNDTQSSGQISAPLASQDSQPSYCSPGTVAMPQLLLTNCTTRVDLPVIHGTGSGPLELQSGCSSPTSRLPPVDDLAIESHDEISDATGWEVCEMEVDGMGVISSNMQVTASRTRRSSEYFGPSSTLSLLYEAHYAIHQRIHGQKPRAMGSRQLEPTIETTQTHSQNAPLSRYRTSTSECVPFGLLSVPPRAEADALVDSYGSWVHSLYPFVHLPSFQRRYLLLWGPTLAQRNTTTGTAPQPNVDYYDKTDDKLFYCLVNVIFALGALFSPIIATQERQSISKTFIDRSKLILDFELLSCGSTTLVQTLLLMGQYLQSTDFPSSCWNIVGLAIRVAQGIGLHIEPRCCRGGQSCPKGHDQLGREMRRRTWTGAVLFDRVLSLTYGRPLMIHPVKSKAQFVLPSAIDDKFLSRDWENPGCQSSGSVSLIECYVQAVKLQEILAQVLTTFYNQGTDDNGEVRKTGQEAGGTAIQTNNIGDDDLQILLNMDELLSAWHRDLPNHLKIQSYEAGYSQNSIFSLHTNSDRLLKRQAIVLKARFLHVRLTLLRPALSTLCDQGQSKANSLEGTSSETSMRHEMMVNAANLCVSAAQELVELIVGNMNLGSSIERLPAPWYNVLYIHNSAIVLLLGYLCWPMYIKGITEGNFLADYRRCIAFLQAYQSYSSSASRSGKILEAMQRQVFRVRNVTGYGNDQNPGADSKGPACWETQSSSMDPDIALSQLYFPLAPSDMISPSIFTGDSTLNPLNQGWLDEQSLDMASIYDGPRLYDM